MATQDIGDRFITEVIAQLQQLTLNALITPAVLTRQTHHQPLDVSISAWSSPHGSAADTSISSAPVHDTSRKPSWVSRSESHPPVV